MALGTRGRFDRAGIGRGLDALFQKPGLQIPRQLRGLLLDAVERGQGLGWVFRKQAIEDRVDVLVQLAADPVAARLGVRGCGRRGRGRHG